MARVAEVPCRKCGKAKVSMRNGKGAPFLGCPVCNADEPAQAPENLPEPVPAPQPTPERPRRRFRTFLHYAMED